VSNNLNKKQGCGIAVGAVLMLSVCGMLGKASDFASKAPTAFPTQLPTVTREIATVMPTATAMIKVNVCGDNDVQDFNNALLSVEKHWMESTYITAIDAVTSEWNNTKQPLGCGDDAVLEDIDAMVRIAIAERKTAMMMDDQAKRDKHMIAAISAYSKIVEYQNSWLETVE
jgi:hypothetical protein